MKLDFVCVGAQKAGTTALHDTLSKITNVCLASNKEAHWFEIEERYKLGLDQFFLNFYDDCNYNDEKVGLINPNLILKEKALLRLKEDFPDIKVIYIIREPLERAWSHYLMSRRRGIETLEFGEALAIEKQRIYNPSYWTDRRVKTSEPGFYELNHFSYKFRGEYKRQIKSLYNIFGSENVLVSDFEDLKSNSSLFINNIGSFIGVDCQELYVPKSNESKGHSSSNISFYNSQVIRFFRIVLAIVLPAKIGIKLRKLIRSKFLEVKVLPSLNRKRFLPEFEDLSREYISIKQSL